MRPSEYRALLEDVRLRGIQEPIHVAAGLILDGHHRVRVARELGLRVVPSIEVVLPTDDPSGTRHLLAAALNRRHLSDDQRAVLAAIIAKDTARKPGRPPRNETRAGAAPKSGDRHRARAEAAMVMAVSSSKVKQATQLLLADKNLGDAVRRGELKLAQALRQVKRAEQLRRIESTELPTGVFRTITADVPWRYEDAGCLGAAEGQYPTMPLSEICALPVAARAAGDAHLYLWTTGPMLLDAFKVIEAWGFTYVTTLVWKKDRLGLGRYFRSQSEFVLFAVRGKLPLKAQDIPNVFDGPVTTHSTKPDEFFDLVERASPGPYLELFARRSRLNWTCWGAECEPLDSQIGPPQPGIIGTTSEVKRAGGDS